MPDELADFFRCVKNTNGWNFQVGVVAWDGHEPSLEWQNFRLWKTTPDHARLHKARAAALTNPRFFRTCNRCRQLNNAGHMHDRDTCQSCAERYLGVIY